MLVTLFRNRESPVPANVIRLDWADAIAGLVPSNPNTYTNKRELPAFNCVEWPKGEPRAKRTALRAHALVLDFDGLTDDGLSALLVRLAEYRAFVYTTWSHYSQPNKVRAVLDVSRPVEREDWPAFWSRAIALFPECDRACSDISHIFYPPYAPAPHSPITVTFDGKAIDVDAWLTMPAATGHGSPLQLARLAKRLQRRDPDLATAMTALGAGTPFAEPGTRDNVAFKLSLALAEEWPDESPDVLAALFVPSLAAMAHEPGAITLDNVTDKIRRAQENYANDITAIEREARLARQGRLADLGRDSPYSEAEIDRICAEQNITRELLRRRWIVIRDRAHYVLAPGGYRGPYTASEAPTAVLRDLAPASSAGVILHRPTRSAIVRKTMETLLEEYGTACADAEVSMLAPFTTYDGNKLIEATCRLRPFRPVKHDDVDAWLGVLGGDVAHKLRSWIAAVTFLDSPCSALLLIGAPGTGKSLLAHGLAQLWGPQPTDMMTALSQFNGSVTRQPLIMADEVLPKDFKGVSRTGELRRAIQERSRLIHRKYLPDMECVGACRYIVCSNATSILEMNENLTREDVAAIAERFLHVPCNKPAGEFLKGVDTRKFAESAIAEHALWLRDNYEWSPEGRFLVSGAQDELYRTIAALSGTRSDVSRWLVSWILSPQKMAGAVGAMVAKKGRAITAHSGTIEKYWDIYIPSRPPPYKEILKALDAMSSGKDKKAYGARVKDVQYEYLVDWIRASDHCSVEDFLEALDK